MTGLKLEFSTGLVHPRDRFDLWHDVACKSYAQHECASETASRFHGAISTAPLALSTLSVYENSAMHLWRTARQVQRSPSERIFVCLQLENFCRIEQFGREAILAPGDFCIVDTRWPYDFTYPKQSRQLVVNVPVTQLERRVRIDRHGNWAGNCRRHRDRRACIRIHSDASRARKQAVGTNSGTNKHSSARSCRDGARSTGRAATCATRISFDSCSHAAALRSRAGPLRSRHQVSGGLEESGRQLPLCKCAARERGDISAAPHSNAPIGEVPHRACPTFASADWRRGLRVGILGPVALLQSVQERLWHVAQRVPAQKRLQPKLAGDDYYPCDRRCLISR